MDIILRRIIIFLVMFSGIDILAQGTGVSKQLNQAEQYYKEEKYAEASQVLTQILAQNPEFEPAIILYARTAFKLAQWTDVVSLYGRVALERLEGRELYEFGYSHFALKNWNETIKILDIVPEHHPAADLAAYYAGVASLKLRKYPQAREKFDKAEVLPEKLSNSRDLYLKHLEDLRLLHQKRKLDKQKKNEEIRLKKQLDEGAKSEPRAKKTASKVESLYNGRKKLEQSAELGTYNKTQNIYNHGYSTQNALTNINYFEFLSGYSLEDKKNKQQSSFGIQARLKIEDEQVKGKEQRVIVFEEKEGKERVVTNDIVQYERTVTTPVVDEQSGNYKQVNGRVMLEPWMEFSILENGWLAFVGHMSYKYPELNKGRRSGTRGLGVEYYATLNQLNTGVKFEYSDIVDDKAKPTLTQLTTQLEMNVQYTSSKLLALIAYKDFRYFAKGVLGPNSISSLTLGWEEQFPYNIVFGIDLAAESLNEYYLYSIPNVPQASANAIVYSSKIKLDMNAFSWLKLGLMQSYQQRKWVDVLPSGNDQLWEENAPNFIDELVWKMSIYKKF